MVVLKGRRNVAIEGNIKVVPPTHPVGDVLLSRNRLGMWISVKRFHYGCGIINHCLPTRQPHDHGLATFVPAGLVEPLRGHDLEF
jgi:hypothetical protein